MSPCLRRADIVSLVPVLFDVTVLGMVLPIGLGTIAVHVARTTQHRWARIVGWIAVAVLCLFLLTNLVNVALLLGGA